MFERELRDLSWVPRWSIIRTNRAQSVAEHSYYVAVYALSIAQLINWRGSSTNASRLELVISALNHDIEECFTGDIPGPMKRLMAKGLPWRNTVWRERDRRFGDRYPVSDDPEVLAILKAADVLDEVMFLAGELQRGNRACENIFSLVIGTLEERWSELPASKEVIVRGWAYLTVCIARERNGHSLEVPADSDAGVAEGDPADRPQPSLQVTQTPQADPDPHRILPEGDRTRRPDPAIDPITMKPRARKR